MSIAEGDIIVGKVTGVTNFGAFVDLPEGKNGLVHISEISNDYVEKVEDYVSKDDEVKVKIISISDNGKIGLSMKQAEEKKKEQKVKQPTEVSFERPKGDSFEDMMTSYLKDSNTRMESIRSRDGKRGTGQRYRS